MKHRTSNTSASNHQVNIATGLYSAQETKVLDALTSPSMTYNQLCRATGLRESSMSRCVRGLLDKGALAIDKIDKCPISGRSVRWLKHKSIQTTLF